MAANRSLHLHAGCSVIGTGTSFVYISRCYLTWGVDWTVLIYAASPETLRLGIIAKVWTPAAPTAGGGVKPEDSG